MRNVLAFILGLLLAIFAGIATAQTTCPRWSINFGSTTITGEPAIGHTPEASCSNAKTLFEAHYAATGNNNYVVNSWAVTGSGTTRTCTFNYSTYSKSTGAFISSGSVGYATTQSGTMACPPDPCDAYAGKKVTYAQQFAGGLPSVGGTTNYNIPVAGGCGATRTAVSSCTENPTGFFCFATYEYTGDAPTSSPTSPGGSQADCAMIAGERNCGLQTNETTDQTCGTYNGERVCYTSDPTQVPAGAAAEPPAGQCWSTAAGGLLCSSTAAVTDDTGATVAPTQTIVTGNSTTNYYSPSTVSSSNVTTVVTGAGDMGSTTPGAEDDCEGLDCLEGGDMDLAAGADESAVDLYGRIEGAPIVAALAGVSGSLSGGSCPNWSDTIEAGVFGTYELDFGFICGLWESIAGVISAVCLAGFVLMGIRILMSA